MTDVFDSLELQHISSVANFVTLVFENGDNAKGFTQNMLKNGVILRHLIGFGLPECVRVTIGTVDENKFFIEKLNNIMEKTV